MNSGRQTGTSTSRLGMRDDLVAATLKGITDTDMHPDRDLGLDHVLLGQGEVTSQGHCILDSEVHTTGQGQEVHTGQGSAHHQDIDGHIQGHPLKGQGHKVHVDHTQDLLPEGQDRGHVQGRHLNIAQENLKVIVLLNEIIPDQYQDHQVV